MVASITSIQSAPNFLLDQILIWYCLSQIFEVYHIYNSSVSYLDIMILPRILVTRHQHIFTLIE